MKRLLTSMSAALALVAISQTACWAQTAYDVKIEAIGGYSGGTHIMARIVNIGKAPSPRFEFRFVGAARENVRTPGDFSRGGFAPSLEPGAKTVIKVDAKTFIHNNLGKTVSFSLRLNLADSNPENSYTRQFFVLPKTVD